MHDLHARFDGTRRKAREMARYFRNTLTRAITVVSLDDDVTAATLIAARQPGEPNRPLYEQANVGDPDVTPANASASVADSGWIVPALLNGATNAGAVAYRKIGNRVQFRGLLGGVGGGQIAFTLPAGYRPPGNYNPIFASPPTTAGGQQLVQVNGATSASPGAVSVFAAGAGTFPARDGVSFLVD
jgi:hypothetical protein